MPKKRVGASFVVLSMLMIGCGGYGDDEPAGDAAGTSDAESSSSEPATTQSDD